MFSEKVDFESKKNSVDLGDFTKAIVNACNSLEKEVERTKGEIDTLKTQNEELRAKYERLSKAYDDVVAKKNKALEIAGQVDTLKDKVSYLEEALEQADATIDKQKGVIQGLNMTVDALKKHAENDSIHKKPLNDQARQKSLQTRQANAPKRVKDNRIVVCLAIEDYWNRTIGNQGDSRKCERVDLSQIMAVTKMSETTIREIVKDNEEEIKQWAYQNSKMHLYAWVCMGGKYKNVPR